MSAQAPPASSRLSLVADIYIRANPAGGLPLVGPVFQHSYAMGDSPLLRNLYVRGGVMAGANPAYGVASAFVEAAPVALLQIRAQADGFRFFGAYGTRLRFPSAESPYGTREQEELRGKEKTGLGYKLLLSPVLRARFGPLVIRNQTDLAYFRMASEPGYYLELEYDTLLKRRDRVISNRAALLGVLWEGEGDEILLAGPAHEVTHAAGANITRHRAEAIVYLTPATHWAGLDRPRILGIVGVNLRDRNREREPFGFVGVGADLDLWTSP